MVPTITDSNFLSMLAVYGVLILMNAFLFELVIAVFLRIDDKDVASIELPVIAEMALSPLFLLLVMNTKLYVQGLLTPTSVAGIIAFGILSTGLCFMMLTVAHQDIEARKKLASQTASVRQANHARREVEAIAKRAVSVRMLRHDLANQMAVVDRLVSSEQTAEADRYLQALQEQSQRLLR